MLRGSNSWAVQLEQKFAQGLGVAVVYTMAQASSILSIIIHCRAVNKPHSQRHAASFGVAWTGAVSADLEAGDWSDRLNIESEGVLDLDILKQSQNPVALGTALAPSKAHQALQLFRRVST